MCFQTFPELSQPVHVLVFKKGHMRNTKTFICHLRSCKVPQNHILEVGEGLYVVSPELVFLQMTEQLSVREHIGLGFELCGIYGIYGNGLFKREPLTTVKRLDAFIATADHVRGARKGSQSLRYVLEHSASPMETALTMLLCLPYRMGGYGIERPFLNYRIHSNKISNLSGCYECDLYWPLIKLAIEYDSDMFHAETERMNKDSIRRSDLNLLGITVVTVTRGQLVSQKELHKIARLLAKLTGKRLQYKKTDFRKANAKLRTYLFGKEI